MHFFRIQALFGQSFRLENGFKHPLGILAQSFTKSYELNYIDAPLASLDQRNETLAPANAPA